MSVKVWDGSNAEWDTSYWFTASNGMSEAETIALDNKQGAPEAGDTVYVSNAAGPNQPTTIPAAVTVANYTSYGLNYDTGANLTVSDTLTMGTVAGIDSPVFSGTALAGCVVVFRGGSNNSGTVGNLALFKDNSVNNGIAGNYAWFESNAYNTGTVGTDATFNDLAYNSGTVGTDATFNDLAYNTTYGTVGTDATFNDLAYNTTYGTVGNLATFNNSAYNTGTVGTYATFNNSAYNTGTVGNLATFNSDSTAFNGTYTGTQYYVAAPIVFLNTCQFTGTAPIIFSLTTKLAYVDGKFTSNGGTTPKRVKVNLDAAAVADLVQANILTGKTILGVVGAMKRNYAA